MCHQLKCDGCVGAADHRLSARLLVCLSAICGCACVVVVVVVDVRVVVVVVGGGDDAGLD